MANLDSKQGPHTGRGDEPALSAGGDLRLRPIELSSELITRPEDLSARHVDYARLQRQSGNTLPFALAEWHLCWCRHFLHRRSDRDEQLHCQILRDRSGECVAIVPLVLTHRRVGPLRLATLAFVGADEGLTEISGPLIEPGYESLTVRTVHSHVAGLAGWDWINWGGVEPAVAEALTREALPLWCESVEDFVLDLPSSWEELRRTMKRNLRESLRHCYNSLRRGGHRFELEVARTGAAVQQALPRFLELHRARAAMSGGARHPDRFASRTAREFLAELCARLAARDAVRIFELRIAGAVVASRMAFVVGDSLYLYFSGFDPAWARYSVMTTALAEAFRYVIAEGLRTVNLSITAEQSKLRWNPRRITYGSALVHRESLGARLACHAYRLALSHHGAPARLVKGLIMGRRWI